MDKKNIQLGLINVIMGGGFLIMLLMLRSVPSLQDFLFWIATALWFYHWYWGLIFVITNCGATEDFLELAFDFIIVGTLVSTLFWIDMPRVWFTLNAFTFLFAIIKYQLILKTRKLTPKVTKYVKEKLKIEWGALVSLTAAVIISILYGQYLLLAGLTIAIHLLSIIYIVYTKLYSV